MIKLTQKMMMLPLIAHVMVSSASAMTYREMEEQIVDELMAQNVLSGNAEAVQVRNMRATIPGMRGMLTDRNFDQVVSEYNLALVDVDLDRKYNRFSFVFKTENQTSDAFPEGKMLVNGMYQGMVNMPVLAVRKQRGEEITESDITHELVAQNEVGNRAVYSSGDLVGMVAKGRLNMGRMMNVGDVERKRIVEKGSMISVTYNSHLIEVKITGKALEDGAVGDVIRVRNNKSGVIIQAEVMKNGETRVNHNEANFYNKMSPGKMAHNQFDRREG